MRVAIVDDEQVVREMLEKYVKRFEDEHDIEIFITSHSSGDEFLEDFKLIYDIIIFDIDMPGINGMNTAKHVREVDKNVTILFITNIAQYAINGYEVDAVDYIIKPISYYEFSMKFERAIAKAAQKSDHTLLLDTVEGIRNVQVSSIIYVEVISHYLYFHSLNSVYKIRGSMKEQIKELKVYNFVRVHKSYLVNMKFIEEIQTKEIIVRGRSVPVGRGYKASLMQEFMKYIRGY
jgi:two-component system, LytTR family, response regulator LytT